MLMVSYPYSWSRTLARGLVLLLVVSYSYLWSRTRVLWSCSRVLVVMVSWSCTSARGLVVILVVSYSWSQTGGLLLVVSKIKNNVLVFVRIAMYSCILILRKNKSYVLVLICMASYSYSGPCTWDIVLIM